MNTRARAAMMISLCALPVSRGLAQGLPLEHPVSKKLMIDSRDGRAPRARPVLAWDELIVAVDPCVTATTSTTCVVRIGNAGGRDGRICASDAQLRTNYGQRVPLSVEAGAGSRAETTSGCAEVGNVDCTLFALKGPSVGFDAASVSVILSEPVSAGGRMRRRALFDFPAQAPGDRLRPTRPCFDAAR